MPNNVEKYRVTANSLNVRNTPSMSDDNNIIGHLEINSTVELIEKSPNLYWFKIKKGNLVGWASHRFLELVVPNSNEEFPWMPIALAEIGVKEVPEEGDNPRIVQYLRTTDLDNREASNDETAWCSAFANFCVERAGYEGTDSASARSWLNWGQRLDTPRRGCIVVFKRDPDPNAGHVSFYISENAADIQVFGGNQDDEVKIKDYPKARLLGYRIPR